ncbi:reticulon-3 [Pezoporus flaviventris]|uniref:reticulon-3 n=2 Tax=Pezoporus TaxID=35539 RepID=UPI002AB22EBE|nr:reticulon-3 [Pezoporus flaviventris]
MAEREVLSQIPEDRVCDFPVKARTGNGIPGLPAKLPTGLSRQASGTAAALEEVSKCVREMHSFTSELLSWDLVERNGGNGNSAGNPGPAEADSSGDSDDTVIEEAPMEEAPIPIPPGASPVPNPVPAARDWEEERLTLRALQELGEPPRVPPDPSGNVAEPRPAAGRPLLLQPSLAARELLLWRDPRRSALVLGASLAPLLSLAALSAVSVCAHVALALLCVTVSARAARGLLQALHRAEEGHPFRTYLEKDITVSQETFRAVVAAATPPLNRALRLLLRLFLVEDLVDSLKLAVCMWLLTYVGAVFNGITLLILADILAFSLPPLYEKYKVQIDQYMAIARSRSKDLMAKIQAKVPGLAKKKPE